MTKSIDIMVLICTSVYTPLRSAPSHKSEMISQIIFGEKYRVTDETAGWLKVTTLFDNCTGWIDSNHIEQTQAGEGSSYVLTRPLICYDTSDEAWVIEPGCEICEPDFDEHTFRLGEKLYTTEGELSSNHIEKEGMPSATAGLYIKAPYLWGGRLTSGIDCSGFTQMVYKIEGFVLPRDSWMQAEIGTTVNFLQEALPGDLLFFCDEKEKINHVAMLYHEDFVVHASGRVRIDPVDHQGIFRADTGKYTHRLRLIKRIIK